jgi:hypothetical protein
MLLPPYLPHPTPQINTVEGSEAEEGAQQEVGVGVGEGEGGWDRAMVEKRARGIADDVQRVMSHAMHSSWGGGRIRFIIINYY